MNNNDDLIRKVDMWRIATEGARIYEEIKTQYDPKEHGKFLAIDVDSREVYLGATSAEALSSAMKNHPDKVFYIVKIGFDTAETMAMSFLERN